MKYDVVVIGGGPAGIMAAGRAGELGARVLLLEKNKSLGVKLLATGGGRCNVTNKTDDLNGMISKFGKNGKFLFPAFNEFTPVDVIDFLIHFGVKTKTESGGRVFPDSDKARDVLNALIGYLKSSGVEIKTCAEVKNIATKNDRIEKVITADGKEIFASRFIIATGGKSYPATGSTGDGYCWLKKLGHKITEPRSALASVIVKDEFVKELEGVSLKDAGVSIYKDNKKTESKRGEAVFTSNGMSGPAILDISKKIALALSGDVGLKIDFVPDLDFTAFDLNFRKNLNEGSNKIFKNSFGGLLPVRLVELIAKLAGIDANKKANLITRGERKKVTHLIKGFDLKIKALAGFDRAMITSGGIDLREVDPKTMKSKIINNLYFAGEILGIDGPTGGYNLHVAWSTGRLAGENAAESCKVL